MRRRGLIWGDVLPGMITATVGTGLLVVVVVSSVAVARRRLSYEFWYALHVAAYAGIALGWFHQIPTGERHRPHHGGGAVLAQPLPRDACCWSRGGSRCRLINAFRHRLRVVGGCRRGAGGRLAAGSSGGGLSRMRVVPGQFFIWRFLSRGFLVGAAAVLDLRRPRRQSLRITRESAREPLRADGSS